MALFHRCIPPPACRLARLEARAWILASTPALRKPRPVFNPEMPPPMTIAFIKPLSRRSAAPGTDQNEPNISRPWVAVQSLDNSGAFEEGHIGADWPVPDDTQEECSDRTQH